MSCRRRALLESPACLVMAFRTSSFEWLPLDHSTSGELTSRRSLRLRESPQDDPGHAIGDHERDERVRVALRLIVDPAREHRGGYRGDALEHADPAADGGEVGAPETIADQCPRHGVDAVAEREQQ